MKRWPDGSPLFQSQSGTVGKYHPAVPDSFNHGTSQQRSRWLKKGIQTGDINQGDTFSVRYEAL